MAGEADQPGDGGTWSSRGVLSPSFCRAKTSAAGRASFGRAAARHRRSEAKGAAMSTSIEQLDERMRRKADRLGTTVVRRGELLRHPVYTRVLHWLVAICFVLSLLSGFAVYSPWLFRWLTPLFGGGPTARLLHPWFGLAFDIFFFFQFVNWFAPMVWTEADRRWMRRIKEYTTNREKLEPEYVGFFNGGQKLYFWAIVISGLLFLIRGLLMWFGNGGPR